MAKEDQIQPAVALPPWAKLGPRPRDLQHVEVDASVAYPMLLEEIGAKKDKPSALDVEVARNFIFWDVLLSMRSRQLEIRINDTGHQWALSRFDSKPVECPVCHANNPSCGHCGGSGRMEAARAGARLAREVYAKLRGIRPK